MKLSQTDQLSLHNSQRKLPDRWFVGICSTLMALLTSMPYVFGYLIAPANRVFMGIITRTPDIAQYLAWMKRFMSANLISDSLTPEPNEAVFFNLLWWTLAKISKILSLEPMLVVQAYRILSIFVFAGVLYWFIGLIMPEIRYRRAAFLVTYFGAGLGWIYVVLKYTFPGITFLGPKDVYVVEPNSYLSMLGISHFPISAALILLVFGFFLIGYEQHKWKYTLFASLAAIILGWEHAYDLLLVYAILGVFILVLLTRDGFSWRPILSLFVIGITSCWPALYSIYITRTYVVWKSVLSQFDNAGAWTPDPFHLLFLMGLPFIAAIFAFDGLVPIKERSIRSLFVRVWFIVNLFLIYIPLNFQIHYLNGWQIPTAILAVEAFFNRMLPWLQSHIPFERLKKAFSPQRIEKGVVSLVFTALLLTNIYLFLWHFYNITRFPHDIYLYSDEKAALKWLAQTAKPDDVILSAIDVGQYIPSQTGAKAFLAHWAMTKDLYQKQDIVQKFFDGTTSDDFRIQTINEYSVDYVIISTQESSLGNYDPSQSAFLQLCFNSPLAKVYCVKTDQLALLH